MCLLILTKNFPDRALLEIGHEQNPHGAGIAWRDRVSKSVMWNKGLSVDELMEYGETGIKGPWLIHFRYSTAGGIIPNLCHPFPVQKSCSTDLKGSAGAVLAHNGHWYGWKSAIVSSLGTVINELPGGPWSDSRTMAWLVAHYNTKFLGDLVGQRIAYMDMKDITRFGEGWVDAGDGLFLSYDPWLRQRELEEQLEQQEEEMAQYV